MFSAIVLAKPAAVDIQFSVIGDFLQKFQHYPQIPYMMSMVFFVRVPREFWEQAYEHVKELPVFNDMVDYLSSDPSLLTFIHSPVDIFQRVTHMKKATREERRDIGMPGYFNMLHVSDSPEAFDKELHLLHQYCLGLENAQRCNSYLWSAGHRKDHGINPKINREKGNAFGIYASRSQGVEGEADGGSEDKYYSFDLFPVDWGKQNPNF